jgi:diguanylate cyclase (GGDEF)-like protein
VTPNLSLTAVLFYPLILNGGISVIVGAALLLVWRYHRAQSYIRDLGFAHLAQALTPLGYLLVQATNNNTNSRFMAVMLVVSTQALYFLLMAVGISRMSRWFAARSLRRNALYAAPIIVAAIGMLSDPLAAAWISPVAGVLLGLGATSMLRHRTGAERTLGPVLILIGVSQAAFPIWGEDGIAWQACLGAMLRVIMALVLVYATLEKSKIQTQSLQSRLFQLVERSHQGVLVYDGAVVLYANAAFLQMHGCDSQDKIKLSQLLLTVAPVEVERVRDLYARLERGDLAEVHWQGWRARLSGLNGHHSPPMWLRESAWRTVWDGRHATQILVTDETAQHDATEALLRQALHDELTGLPNRAALLLELRKRCGLGLKSAPFGLALLGLDRFKLFNEAHGHSLGDEVLRMTAQALRDVLGHDVQVMRIGADEFAWLTPANGAGPDVMSLCAQVQRHLRQPLGLPQRRLFLDASIGIALFPEHAHNAETLLRAANAAMHIAKRTPGPSQALADASFALDSSQSLDQEQALRHAIERREFTLRYQPKVNAVDGRLIGFEALARWDRGGAGAVSPVEFIAAAERTGLIGNLGLLLLRQACQQAAAWRDAFGEVVPVAVNVSPLQLLEGDFPTRVAHLLDRFGLPPEAITLELTESAVVANLDLVRVQIAELRNLGVEVALDDFGTGFSSLNLLRSLPVHTVKIDRGLIDPLPAPDAVAVVRAICQLARALGLSVVAEGVENRAQADAARDAGCDALQGELFAQPLTLTQAGAWLLAASYYDTEDAEIVVAPDTGD